MKGQSFVNIGTLILLGTVTLEVNAEHITLNSQEGIEIPPLIPHQMMNNSSGMWNF